MTALPCQMIEPPGNLVRVGAHLAASQLQRKAEAQVLYVDPATGSGFTNTIDPNKPAIPWTSSTGFGNGQAAPTTAGTVDLTNFSRYVTFIVAQPNGTLHVPMYVCREADWDALAKNGTRVLVALDVYEFHGSHYAGREYVVSSWEQRDIVTVSIPDWTDATTHGDYGTQHITFPAAFTSTTLSSGAAIGATTVTVASVAGLSVGHMATLAQLSGSHLTERRRITAINTSTHVVTLSAGLTNAYSTGDTVQMTPVLDVSSTDIGWIADWDNATATGFDLILSRRVSLTNSEGGAVIDPATGNAPTIFSGNTNVLTDPISFPTAYQAPPLVEVQTGDANYTAVAESVTTTTFRVRVTHTPQGSSGTIAVTVDKNTTDLSVDTGATGLSVDTNTMASLDLNPASTGIAIQNENTHTHPIANPGTSTDTGAGTNHNHSVTDPEHSHSIVNAGHGHSVTDPGHDHSLTEPNGGAGHDHTATATFTGASTAVGSNTTVPCTWIGFGTRQAPAVSKDASWIARGS